MATLKNISNSVWGLSVVGYGVIVEGVAAIRQRIDLAIRTTKGTDPLRPEFGTNVNKYIDRKTVVAVPNIKREILAALQMWVPEITVISINHSFPNDYSNPHFEITYRLADDGLIDRLLLDLREGIATVPDQLSELILQAFFPDNPNSYPYTLTLTRNGSQLFPLPNPSGFASIQALFDWAKTNLFYAGKWFLLPDKMALYMKADGVKSATLLIETLPVTVFKADFPQLGSGQVYTVSFAANGMAATPAFPQTFSSPGAVLTWVKSNWSEYANWMIEFVQSNGEGLFSDEFSDEFLTEGTGFRLVGVSHQKGFVADLQIGRVNANKFSAIFPTLNAGETYKVEFKKDGVFVNPNMPTTYTTAADVLAHANTYWGNLAQWSVATDAGNLTLFGLGLTAFNASLTITKI